MGNRESAAERSNFIHVARFVAPTFPPKRPLGQIPPRPPCPSARMAFPIEAGKVCSPLPTAKVELGPKDFSQTACLVKGARILSPQAKKSAQSTFLGMFQNVRSRTVWKAHHTRPPRITNPMRSSKQAPTLTPPTVGSLLPFFCGKATTPSPAPDQAAAAACTPPARAGI